MTPLEIETLIQVYAQPCAKLNDLGVKGLKCHSLVEYDLRVPPKDGKTRHGIILTPKGKAMMIALMSLPMPERTVIWTTEMSLVTEEKPDRAVESKL